MFDYLINLYTVTELKLIALAGAAWAIFAQLVGGLDEPIIALIWFVAADFVTGILAAGITKSWSSKYGFQGMCKKATMFVIVALMFFLDIAMQTHMLRGMAISGFAIIEVMSIIENIDRCGWGECIPNFIRSRLVQIREEKKI